MTGLKNVVLQNVLERPVFESYPIIRSIKTALLEQGAAWALMSGSGSTVFGIFDDQTLAEKTRQNMERPGWLVVVTQTQQRKPERRL